MQIAVLPDAARVEERLARLARQRGFVAGKVACSLAELERGLVREAQQAGTCPQIASPFALQLALREAARNPSPGPYFAIRNHAGYARALGDLLSALTHGLLPPLELTSLDAPERAVALGRTLLAARQLLDRAALADPHLALGLAIEHVERGGALPAHVAAAAELEFDGVLDWTPLRLRLATALAHRMRVRIRLPWSAGRPELTEALEPTLRALERLGEPAPELELFDPAEASPALAPFLRRLFAPEGPAVAAPVELVSCASPAAQALEVARRCAALIRSGVAADSIAVAARSLASGVAEQLAAAFDRAGVPWRERRGRPALAAAPVRLALALLELVEEDFPREPLIDLLCSRLLSLRGTPGMPGTPSDGVPGIPGVPRRESSREQSRSISGSRGKSSSTSSRSASARRTGAAANAGLPRRSRQGTPARSNAAASSSATPDARLRAATAMESAATPERIRAAQRRATSSAWAAGDAQETSSTGASTAGPSGAKRRRRKGASAGDASAGSNSSSSGAGSPSLSRARRVGSSASVSSGRPADHGRRMRTRIRWARAVARRRRSGVQSRTPSNSSSAAAATCAGSAPPRSTCSMARPRARCGSARAALSSNWRAASRVRPRATARSGASREVSSSGGSRPCVSAESKSPRARAYPAWLRIAKYGPGEWLRAASRRASWSANGDAICGHAPACWASRTSPRSSSARLHATLPATKPRWRASRASRSSTRAASGSTAICMIPSYPRGPTARTTSCRVRPGRRQQGLSRWPAGPWAPLATVPPPSSAGASRWPCPRATCAR